MSDTIRPFTKPEAKAALKECILTASLKKIETAYGVLEGVTAENASEVEKTFFKACSEEDRFGYYQVYLIKGDNNRTLNFSTTTFSHDFIRNPVKEQWYSHVLSATNVAFGRYTTSERRSEKTETLIDGTVRTTGVTEPKDVFLNVDVELIKTAKRWAVVLKFPWYRRKLSQGYTFQKEGIEIMSWLTQSLQVEVEPFGLKDFFENFTPHGQFDKSEFRVTGMMSDSGLQNAVAMRFASPEKGLTDAYENLDRVLASSLNSGLLERFSEWVDKSELTDKEAIKGHVASFFETKAISSQEIFEILTQTFEFGLGTISYAHGKDVIQYKLDYTEDVNGLIRSSKLGWSVFERIWNQIIQYIDR